MDVIEIKVSEALWNNILTNPSILDGSIKGGEAFLLIPEKDLKDSIGSEEAALMLRILKDHYFKGVNSRDVYVGIAKDNMEGRAKDHDPRNHEVLPIGDETFFDIRYPMIGIKTKDSDFAAETEYQLTSPYKSSLDGKLYFGFHNYNPFSSPENVDYKHGASISADCVYIGVIHPSYIRIRNIVEKAVKDAIKEIYK